MSENKRPPIGRVHRASLEAFRQGDPDFAAYLEEHGRVEIIEEGKKT